MRPSEQQANSARSLQLLHWPILLSRAQFINPHTHTDDGKITHKNLLVLGVQNLTLQHLENDGPT